jgi:hypothetical protein
VGRPLIYLDANVVIRLVEGDAATRAPLVARLTPALGVPGSLATSRLTRLECRSKPLRTGDLATLAQFDVFFAGIELALAEVSPAAIERATDLRAKYNRGPTVEILGVGLLVLAAAAFGWACVEYVRALRSNDVMGASYTFTAIWVMGATVLTGGLTLTGALRLGPAIGAGIGSAVAGKAFEWFAIDRVLSVLVGDLRKRPAKLGATADPERDDSSSPS